MFNSHRGGKPAGGRTGGRSGGRTGRGNSDKKYASGDSDRPGFGRRNRGGPEMFRTTCDNCGQSCEVPFKPTMGKPVYCRDCFDTTGPNPERSGGKSFGKRDYKDFKGKGSKSPESNNVSQAEFDKLNDKLDKILKLLSTKESE